MAREIRVGQPEDVVRDMLRAGDEGMWAQDGRDGSYYIGLLQEHTEAIKAGKRTDIEIDRGIPASKSKRTPDFLSAPVVPMTRSTTHVFIASEMQE